ncbi:CHAT domain-containing protein [Anabaenopsis elenkinii CCIBt3563]|uniref:CHAT domain-containing protein n=1 Tax=Anabaenopsis elenkinii CCIBt3563 TaxID=2779889 RepID=A0A7U3NML9_9CYAN|nr:CHAT domain-containing protein [Anabaenopsis elenkinii CCIBt3563]
MKPTHKKKLRLKPRFQPSVFLLILLFCLTLAIPPVIAQIHTDTIQLIQQGRQLYNSGEFTKAIPVWQQAIRTLPHQSLNAATVWSNLSLTHQQLGEWEAANTAINKSLEILQSTKTTTEQQRILAQTLDIQGQLLQKTGQSQAALNTWQKAARLYPQSVDGQLHQINLINQAQAMEDLGLYGRACQTLLATLDLSDEECDISEVEITKLQQEILANPQKIYQAKALRSLGNVMRIQGNLTQGQKILEASLAIAQTSNLPADESKVLLNLANIELALANRATELRNNRQAAIYRRKALEKYQAADEKAASVLYPDSAILQVKSQLNQLELLIGEQKWTKAQALISPIKVLLTQLPRGREAIYAQISYTRNSLCLQQKQLTCLSPTTLNLSSVDQVSFQEAIDSLNSAAQDAAQLQDQRTKSYILGLVGRLYESRQDWNTANNYTQQALYDSWQAQAPELTYQWQWQQGRLLKAQGKTEAALTVYAQSLANLRSLRPALVAINTENQFNFRENTEPVYRQYVSLLLQRQDNADIPQKNLELARETIDSLQLAELENFLRLVCLDAKPVVIDDITDKQDPTAALIYPILLENSFEIIVKLPQNKDLLHYTTKIDKNIVEEILGELTQELSLANPNNIRIDPRVYERVILSNAQILYQWLLAPAEKDLAQSQTKTLVFVLDSALQNIPMSVLHNGEKYIVEQYNIARAPGLELTDLQPFVDKKPRALIGGLSEVPEEQEQQFSPLPFVLQEVQQVQSQVPSSTKLLNPSFTSAGLKNSLNSTPFTIVHLATHGQFSSQRDDTFLLTWDDRLNLNQLNSLLRSRDQQPIELLVLSACETVKGDRRAALGLAGVAVRAGTPSTLATLWQVNDQSTALFMSEFYQALMGKNMSKAAALRQAQLALLNNPEYNSPYYWAAYVLLGKWL